MRQEKEGKGIENVELVIKRLNGTDLIGVDKSTLPLTEKLRQRRQIEKMNALLSEQEPPQMTVPQNETLFDQGIPDPTDEMISSEETIANQLPSDDLEIK